MKEREVPLPLQCWRGRRRYWAGNDSEHELNRIKQISTGVNKSPWNELKHVNKTCAEVISYKSDSW